MTDEKDLSILEGENLEHRLDDDESSPVIQARFEKARQLGEEGVKLYPNSFRPVHKVAELVSRFGRLEHGDFETLTEEFSLAGRIMALRDYGKSVFFDVVDSSGRIQAYIRKQAVP